MKSDDKSKAETDWASASTSTNPAHASTQSIADMVKETAEQAIAQSDFVFDESSGLYFDKSSGLYYDSVRFRFPAFTNNPGTG
jgi:hypothetical protein